MVVFVDGRASRPQRSVLTDDVLADLELGREAEILHVTVRLGRVQAEQGLVPLAPLVRPLREVFDRDQVSVRPRELPDDPAVDDLVRHRSRKRARSTCGSGSRGADPFDSTVHGSSDAQPRMPVANPHPKVGHLDRTPTQLGRQRGERGSSIDSRPIPLVAVFV